MAEALPLGLLVMGVPQAPSPLGRSWILTRMCLSLSRKSQKASATSSGCRVFLKLVLHVPPALWGWGGGRKRKSLVSLPQSENRLCKKSRRKLRGDGSRSKTWLVCLEVSSLLFMPQGEPS